MSVEEGKRIAAGKLSAKCWRKSEDGGANYVKMAVTDVYLR